MQTHTPITSAPSAFQCECRDRSTARLPGGPVGSSSDALTSLYRAFATCGGIAEADQLAARRGVTHTDGLGRIARWIVQRDVVVVRWGQAYWLPLFQFRLSSVDLDPDLAAPLGMLRPVLDDWDIALWFASPNACLSEANPASVMAAAPGAVFQAARQLRFALQG